MECKVKYVLVTFGTDEEWRSDNEEYRKRYGLTSAGRSFIIVRGEGGLDIPDDEFMEKMRNHSEYLHPDVVIFNIHSSWPDNEAERIRKVCLELEWEPLH